jgi:Transcriptional regulator, AbiEi antitoxin
MPKLSPTSHQRSSAARVVRDRVRRGQARFWKHSDFEGLPPSAVATTLSRLAREGELQRVGKGVYYRPAPTSFGLSIAPASGAAAETLTAPLHPAGLSAANVLGLTTQNPQRPEYATPAAGPPTALRGAVIHTGRPAQRVALSTEDGAILEILRERARSSDLSPEDTTARLLRLLSEGNRYRRLATAAMAEPPRVRAMLGALGQELQMPPALLDRLKRSLNPLSRFDFGRLRSLRYAREWQAK